ncbi:MAG: FeoB-associated Cys-rich membrane protein [Clostridia bacterium]|nr:FeoB-associated Cys-rich membrane protein [Clostridia bacterium]
MTPKTIATIIIASVIALLFIAVVANEIIKKKKGKPSCSCGGNCGACGLCHLDKDNEADKT